jgi:decaprenylphospho-beta-D-erythro-pentofuranosid-2-ulose 2-reductase
MENIFIFGANSDLIYEYIKVADDNKNWYLYSRNEKELKKKVENLSLNKNSSKFYIKKIDFTENFLDKLDTDLYTNKIDKVIIAQGLLVKNNIKHNEYNNLFQINIISVIQIINITLKIIQKQGTGKIIVFGSIAGDIGKSSNYLYGSSKSALWTYVEGLQKEANNYKFITFLKPGPVFTKMTKGHQSNLLWIDKKNAGLLIKRAIEKNKKIVYIPGYWRYIIIILKLLPNFLTKKL